MKIAIIINAKRLTPDLEKILMSKELEKHFNINYDFYICEPQNVETLINQIKTQAYNAYLIGGGDGTVRSALQVLINVDCKVAVLPLGSFNLFAKALNYPADIHQLFEIIKNGKTKQIDLVTVNNTIIINHAWIGFYYYILKLRKKHSDILGKNKFLKVIFNSMSLFKLLPIYNLKIKINDKEMIYQTCLVYVGNNEFTTKLTDLGERKTLSSGLISLTILNCRSRWQLFLCILHIFLRIKNSSPYLTAFLTDDFTIQAKSTKINIVIDGELFKLETPLHFVNEHKTLTMFVR